MNHRKRVAEPDFARSVVANVGRLMVTRGHSLVSLSEASGVPLTTLKRRLSCENDFAVGELKALARVFGVPTGVLLPEDEWPRPAAPSRQTALRWSAAAR